jgi:CelD/BcsL family acetyltransferase involved in cellulose biosynthesis
MTGATLAATWSDAPFTHPPLAPALGPFPRRAFLETWWHHEARDDDLVLVSTGSGALPLRVSEGRVLFIGDTDLTDYHSPLGDPEKAIAAAADRFSGASYSFDSLPAEAATAIHAALDAGGQPHVLTPDTITAVLELPQDHEGWFAGLGKKERHEVRRKRRRFAELMGSPRLERRGDPEAVALFADLHRSSAGAKGVFMTEQRESFFTDLVQSVGAVVDVLVVGDDPIAAAFAFAEPDGYYLYNSAYVPAAAAASPGIVLLAKLIDRLIAEGVPRLDLLKGDEAYKFRLGATARPLYRIEGTFA